MAEVPLFSQAATLIGQNLPTLTAPLCFKIVQAGPREGRELFEAHVRRPE
jgi:hypothetical protein